MPNKSRTKCLWEESEAATELQERVTSTQTLAAQVVPMLLTTLLMAEEGERAGEGRHNSLSLSLAHSHLTHLTNQWRF